jgi:hypothetical protein
VDDLVHLGVQAGVLFGETLSQEFLVESGCKLLPIFTTHWFAHVTVERNSTYISCVLWYVQKPNALPAHSMMVLGSSPLNTLVL